MKKKNNIFRLLRLLYLKLFRINDSPQKIALGLAVGIFLGILPGTGPIAALCAAFILRINRASALIGSLLVNTWTNILTFLLAIKIGSVIMGLDWQKVYTESLSIFKNFHLANLFKLPILKILYPVLIGYFVISAIAGFIAYLTALVIVKRIRLKKISNGKFKLNNKKNQGC
ncbi:MAG: DUF2062 domain-containing protein [Candidatus Omnitrophota bacterium]